MSPHRLASALPPSLPPRRLFLPSAPFARFAFEDADLLFLIRFTGTILRTYSSQLNPANTPASELSSYLSLSSTKSLELSESRTKTEEEIRTLQNVLKVLLAGKKEEQEEKGKSVESRRERRKAEETLGKRRRTVRVLVEIEESGSQDVKEASVNLVLIYGKPYHFLRAGLHQSQIVGGAYNVFVASSSFSRSRSWLVADLRYQSQDYFFDLFHQREVREILSARAEGASLGAFPLSSFSLVASFRRELIRSYALLSRSTIDPPSPTQPENLGSTPRSSSLPLLRRSARPFLPLSPTVLASLSLCRSAARLDTELLLPWRLRCSDPLLLLLPPHVEAAR